MRILKSSAVVAAVATAGLALAVAPAGAVTSVPVLPVAGSQATTFAGYAVAGAGGAQVTSVFTTFRLPSVACPASGSYGVLPFAQIFSSTGSSFAAGGVFVVCEKGKLMFSTYFDINNYSPTYSSFTPLANDKIAVAIKQTAAGAKVTVRDLTQAKAQTFISQTSLFAGIDDTANIGDGAVIIGSTPVANPPFGTIAFSRVWTNGVAIGALPNTVYNEATAATGGTVRIASSKLSAAGNWFKTTFMHA